jgi:hypothetical protein
MGRLAFSSSFQDTRTMRMIGLLDRTSRSLGNYCVPACVWKEIDSSIAPISRMAFDFVIGSRSAECGQI